LGAHAKFSLHHRYFAKSVNAGKMPFITGCPQSASWDLIRVSTARERAGIIGFVDPNDKVNGNVGFDISCCC